MKVLFAVSNENISNSIMKKYQEQHKEIISGKNVYYFNAIIKELQKDKSYDRIVISEDLEPFANNNYDTIDKFIFDKLDSISDEAANFVGGDIPIILICSDRRTKAEPILIKLFGIGVYSALLGNDRSIDKVCDLLNKPRTKKEAKSYYKIDADDVEYKAESEGEVSEAEIQNILFHYKRLGKNEQKYVESFDSIAAQYTDEQLKIIIRVLPLNVKAVLEEKSPTYQKLTTFADVSNSSSKKKHTYVSSYEKEKAKKKAQNSGVELIEKQLAGQKMSKPVIIPSSVNTSRIRKKEETTTTESLGKSLRESKLGPQNYAPAKERMKKQVATESLGRKHAQEHQGKLGQPTTSAATRLKGNTANTTTSTASTTKPATPTPHTGQRMHQAIPSVPVKANIPSAPKKEQPKVQPAVETPAPAKKRGRPRKVEEPIAKLEPITVEPITVEPITVEPIVEVPKVVPVVESKVEATPQPPKRRGRPRKNPLPVEELPVVEEHVEEPVIEETIIEQTTTPEIENIPETMPATPVHKRRGRPRKTVEPAIAAQPVIETPQPQPSVNVFALDEEENNEEDVWDTPIGYQEPDYEEDSHTDYSDIEPTILPGFDDDDDDELFGEIEKIQKPTQTLQSQDYYAPEETRTLPGLEDFEEDEQDDAITLPGIQYEDDDDFFAEDNDTTDIESTMPYTPTNNNLDYLLGGDKKIVAFVGTSKNGTSFLVNNVAELLSAKGIKTAILDATKNKNAYYIYTENEEHLRQTAFNCMKELTRGNASGIKVNKHLDVYTTIPENEEDLVPYGRILETLAQNYTVVLIDCDFETEYGYFSTAQEIYLVQSMDILTIQPLTAFLTDLKAKGILEPEKLRVVLNKYLRVRGVTEKVIIGGMAYYNDPTMSVMTELFNKDTVKHCVISFDEQVYSKYLEGLVECKIGTKGYTKKFLAEMIKLREMVYPLMEKHAPRYGNYKDSGFSNDMNNTLNKMKKSRM